MGKEERQRELLKIIPKHGLTTNKIFQEAKLRGIYDSYSSTQENLFLLAQQEKVYFEKNKKRYLWKLK